MGNPRHSPARALLPAVLVAAVAVAAGLWWTLASIGADPLAHGRHANAAFHADSELAPRAADDATTSSARADAQIAAPDARTARAGLASAPGERWSGGTIVGRVLGGPGATEPIAGIGVRATSPRSTFPVPERRTTTDANGRYELHGLVAAHWEVEASLPAIDLRGASSVVLDEETQPRAELDVLLPYARHVDVRLVDVRGAPITATAIGIDPELLPLVCVGLAGACRAVGATLEPADMALNRIRDESPKGSRTRFDVEIQGGGAQCLHALFGDRVIATRTFGREDERVEIVVDPLDVARFLGPCALQVLGPDRAPIPEATVSMQLAGVAIAHGVDAEGVASFAGLPLGELRVSASAPGYVARTLTVVVPTREPHAVELAPARRLAGRIVAEGRRDVARISPAIWRVRETTAQLGEPTQRITWKRSIAAEFAFEELEPAEYVVAAVPDSVALLSADDVRAGKASGVALVDLRRRDVRDVVLSVPDWLVDE